MSPVRQYRCACLQTSKSLIHFFVLLCRYMCDSHRTMTLNENTKLIEIVSQPQCCGTSCSAFCKQAEDSEIRSIAWVQDITSATVMKKKVSLRSRLVMALATSFVSFWLAYGIAIWDRRWAAEFVLVFVLWEAVLFPIVYYINVYGGPRGLYLFGPTQPPCWIMQDQPEFYIPLTNDHAREACMIITKMKQGAMADLGIEVSRMSR